jgi:hypothetical protein
MIRNSILTLLMIATSRIATAGESASDRHFAAMEARVSVPVAEKQEPPQPAKPPIRKITKKPTPRELHLADQARHLAQRVAPPKVTFDGVYYWNEAGECVGMRTRCKACRIGR